MEKKKDYLLVYLVVIFVVGVFGWMWLKPQPVVYYGEIVSIDRESENIEISLIPADSPYPERDIQLSGPKTVVVGPKGIQLQIREAPDGTRLNYVDLEAMFNELSPGDGIGFTFRDKAESILLSILFTTPTK